MPGFAPVQKAPAAQAPARKDKKAASAGVQAKLSVNTPGDRFEKEADRTADKVMRSPAPRTAPPVSKVDDKAQRAAMPKTDERKVQRAEKKDEKSPKTPDRRVAETGSEKKLQRKKDEHPIVQRDSDGGGEPPSGFETTLARAHQSGGEALAPSAMQRMESGFGRSFDDVRVHSDGAADSAARAIDARAFTLGRDVYFAQGQYQPHTPGGQHLIAHELTHVVQQSGQAASPQTAQRKVDKEPTSAKPAGVTTFDAGDQGKITYAKIDDRDGTVELPYLNLPEINGTFKGLQTSDLDVSGQPRDKKYPLVESTQFHIYGRTNEAGSNTQRFVKGLKEVGNSPVNIQKKITENFAQSATPLKRDDQPVYCLTLNGAGSFHMIGTATELSVQDNMVLPSWDKNGKPHSFQVDHQHELQLGGLDDYPNFWLLDSAANGQSGPLIRQGILGQVRALLKASGAGGPKTGDGIAASDNPAPQGKSAPGNFWTGKGEPPSAEKIVEKWHIVFAAKTFHKIDLTKGNSSANWSRKELKAGDHIAKLTAVADQAALGQLGLVGGAAAGGAAPTRFIVFATKSGGYHFFLDKDGDGWKTVADSGTPSRAANVIAGIGEANVKFKLPSGPSSAKGTAEVATLTGSAFPATSMLKKKPKLAVPLRPISDLGNALYMDRKILSEQLSGLNVTGLSPVSISDSGLSPMGALFAIGTINSTASLFPGLRIPFMIEGDTIRVDFPIPAEKLCFGPVRATWAGLGIQVSPEGIALDGGAGFAIKGLGSGELRSIAGQKGLALEGEFDFDFKKLNPARLAARYQAGALSVDGDIGLEEGAIPGINSANIHVGHDKKGLIFSGTAILGVPGLEGTVLKVHRDPSGNIGIGADGIKLPVTKFPGVKSATASIRAERGAKGEWSVGGRGTAAVGFPGVDGSIGIDIDGKLVTISGQAALKDKYLGGKANVLVTNRPPAKTGKLAGRYPQVQPMPSFTLSGHGEVSLQMGSLLRGTAGVTILPNKDITLDGELALPPSVAVFPKKEFKQGIFNPPSLHIPIFGFTVSGVGVGVFASIGGGIDFKASLGPGQLRDTKMNVRYSPNRPDDAAVHGQATFFVPAYAGLGMKLKGGLGVSALIVSATGGLQVGAELGALANASAAVTVDWTPKAGISIDANAHIGVKPKFVFTLSLFADIDWAFGNIWHDTKDLKKFEFGPDVDFAADLPIHWDEKNGLVFDPAAVKVEPPKIDFGEMSENLVHKLVDGPDAPPRVVSKPTSRPR